MPKIIGKSTRVVETDRLAIDEMVGNVASNEDTLSVARCVITSPTNEPWLTLDYDEWICVIKGRIEMHYGDDQVLPVEAGETCFVASGECFRPVFLIGDTEYIPIILSAFEPSSSNAQRRKRLFGCGKARRTPFQRQRQRSPAQLQMMQKRFITCAKRLSGKSNRRR
jgi:hypothetical protein